MATTKLKFYRGLKARYDAASKHLDAIYFATDTKELLMNGVNYGGSGVVRANRTYQVSILNNIAVMGGAL